MPASALILAIVGLIGGLQAVAIGLSLLTLRAVRIRLFGGLVLLMGLAMNVIVLSHTRGTRWAWLMPAEAGATLLASPLFYLWVTMVVRAEERPGRRRWALVAVPGLWVAYLVGLLGSGAVLTERILAPIELLVAYQVFFTVLAGACAFGERPAAAALRDEVGLARVTVALFVAIHLAQLVRFSSDALWVRDIVPITAAVALFVLTAIGLRHARPFWRGPSGRRLVGDTGLDEERAASVLAKLETLFGEEHVYRRPDLTLRDLARQLGVPRTHLSRLINERRGLSFPELVSEYRVEEAADLLSQPDLDHLTVEAIGARAGFASRSAFYDGFKRATGETPAAFRRQRATAVQASPPPADA